MNMLINNNGNSKIKKNGITNNETKDNKNEEKVMESKDLKSSIMTDNVSNFFNNQNQGNFQDNFSSTSYQTLHKILNKVDPKPLNANKKYNLSHLYTSDALYRTSANFKPKTNNNLIEKNGKFTPLYYKTTSKNGTKTDFYNTKHKLDNRTEKQIYLNIETEDINSDMNHNLNFNTSSSNNYHTLENKRNFFYDEHKNKLIKNKNQNKTLSVKKKKEIISSKLYKSPYSTNKKSLINFINNPYNPYATNWPNSFLKKGFQLGLKLLPHIRKWIASDHVYTARFGLRMLMNEFLGKDFREEYLALAASAAGDDYYLKMMIAWYFATALAKQYDAAVRYLEEGKLDERTRKKAIQKAVESRRVSGEHKEYLKSLR